MGWLLGCFKCTGTTEGVKPKKRLQSRAGNPVSGRSYSATVAHATSPEDLHIVRKLPPGSAAVKSNGHIEREPDNPLSSPLLDQGKTQKSAKHVSRRDEDRVRSQEYDLDGELESFRERLMQDANTAKQLSDEVKFLRGCHSLLESPSNAFKVTFDKADQELIEQVDYAQHSWLVSSLVTRIQPGGLLIETCSRPNSPLLDVCEGGSMHSRVKLASQSNSFDNFGDSNALKCAELSLFRVESGVCDAFVDGICESLQTRQSILQCETNPFSWEHNVPSPPWTFCGTKANEKAFEPSDDLLLENLDVSSLIEDSALITNWELSSGSLFPGTLGLQVPSQEEGKLLQKSTPSKQAKQAHSDSRMSKRVWSSTRKDLFEKESNIGEYLQHKYSDDGHEALLSDMQPETALLQESRDLEDEFHPLLSAISESSMASDNNTVSHAKSLDLNGDGNATYASTSTLEAKVPQDTAQGSYLEDETKLMKNDNPGMVLFPHGEEAGEQRKKMKVEDESLSDRMHESILVEDDEVPLLNAEAFGDVHESSLEVGAESFRNHVSIAAKHENDESTSKQTPLLSFTFSSSSHIGTPPVTRFRSPASLADDRPILGTVAAHWSPIATRKWWDGKGIPNSTNKYQEDQKVNWHAIPFEVRLEQALAKQETVPSK